MKLVKRTEAQRLHLDLLVICLLCCVKKAHSHAIAEAANEATQELQKSNQPKQEHNLRWLIVRHSSNTPHAQLEVPPVAPASQQEQPSSIRQHKTVNKPPTMITTTVASSGQPNSANSLDESTTTSSAQKWIENILINVEVMNLINERRREQIAYESHKNRTSAKDTEEDSQESATIVSTNDEPSMSQMPTDSSEDLLESQPEATTLMSASRDEQAPAPSATQLEIDDQKLVESNNVSAILSAAAAAAATSQDLPGSSSYGAQIVTLASKQAITCEQAHTQCALREVCAPTLKAYIDDCQDLINNRTAVCSAKCLRAMIALKSSEAGEDLTSCDCQDNELCLLSKERAKLCQPEVDKALEPTSVVSCSVASSICMANQLCSTALGYYYRRCQSLFSQRYCSDRCNNSLTILYKQPQAMKLINCQCDGSEEFPCVKYKTYTERLCLNKQSSTTTPTNDSLLSADLGVGGGGTQTDAGVSTSHFDDAIDEDDQQMSAATNEDDGINLTNDPSDLPTLTHEIRQNDDFNGGISGGGNVGNSPSEADSSNSNNYFFNGIQQPAVEDNWIPLVSGRYFTNLQQQQQQQRREQKVKQQQQQSQRKTPTRRAQKNAKQRVRSNEIKRRHSRPYMFALTSAATGSHRYTLTIPFSVLLSVILLTFL